MIEPMVSDSLTMFHPDFRGSKMLLGKHYLTPPLPPGYASKHDLVFGSLSPSQERNSSTRIELHPGLTLQNVLHLECMYTCVYIYIYVYMCLCIHILYYNIYIYDIYIYRDPLSLCPNQAWPSASCRPASPRWSALTRRRSAPGRSSASPLWRLGETGETGDGNRGNPAKGGENAGKMGGNHGKSRFSYIFMG